MTLYTYYDSRKADYCGEGALYFAKLADAKRCAAENIPEGECVEIDLVDVGPVTRELTLRIMNGRGVVKSRVCVCTVPGTKNR